MKKKVQGAHDFFIIYLHIYYLLFIIYYLLFINKYSFYYLIIYHSII